MNIAQAKEQIKNAMRVYFAKDEYGRFCIAPEEQRPVFLMGPPGIGKTAIMKQIAEELGVGLVSYSMTHHTRQSALGLPLIVSKNYGGKEVSVTEYTMSEIIASIYDMAEESGADEGILFLDEINCVSETLTPTMLQFLQFKTFGKHKVPEGWIVVTAGNPPEYNRSAREFDVVTWDRLKRVDVEPDYAAWRTYASKRGVHPAILTYLDARKDNFYKVETTVDGKRFVTARGWVDLSDMITLSEREGIAVDELLIAQYLQDKDIAEDFAAYYELFNKYRSDYKIDAILSGESDAEISARAKNAAFDERLSLLGLLLDKVGGDIRAVIRSEDMVTALLADLKAVKQGASIEDMLATEEEKLNRAYRRGALSPEKRREFDAVMDFLKRHQRSGLDFAVIKADYDALVAEMKKAAATAGEELSNLFGFVKKVWSGGQEMLILVTDLTANYYTSRFISRYGCDAYYEQSKELMFYERQTEIIRQLEELEQL